MEEPKGRRTIIIVHRTGCKDVDESHRIVLSGTLNHPETVAAVVNRLVKHWDQIYCDFETDNGDVA